jgi:hypothetical protein
MNRAERETAGTAQRYTRRERALAALAGQPIEPKALAQAARALSFDQAEWAARQGGYRATEGRRALKLHRERLRLDRPGPDSLAQRRPGYMAQRHRQDCLEAAYATAAYRSARHCHTAQLTVFGAAPSVSYQAGHVRPDEVGLGAAYARKAFSVATSAHHIVAPDGWLRTVYSRGAAVVDGRLVLALADEPDPAGVYAVKWVEQGRGTSIRLESGFVERVGDDWTIVRRAIRRRRAA